MSDAENIFPKPSANERVNTIISCWLARLKRLEIVVTDTTVIELKEVLEDDLGYNPIKPGNLF